MLEQGCIRTGAIVLFPDRGYAIGDLFHYGGCYIFRSRAIVDKPPRPYLNGEFIGWRHQWVEADHRGSGSRGLITIGTDRDFLYYGPVGRPLP